MPARAWILQMWFLWCYSSSLKLARAPTDVPEADHDDLDPRLDVDVCRRICNRHKAHPGGQLPERYIVGLVALSPWQTYTSILTALTQQEQESMALHSCKAQKYTQAYRARMHNFRVMGAWRLGQAQVPEVQGAAPDRLPRHDFFLLTADFARRCFASPAAGDAEAPLEASVARFLDEHDAVVLSPRVPNVAMNVPLSVTNRLFAEEAAWQHLALLGGGFGAQLVKGMWTRIIRPLGQTQLPAQLPVQVCSAEPYSGVANLLRVCSNVVHDDRCLEQVTIAIRWLEGVASSLGVDGVDGLDGPTVPWAYSMTQLIHTMVLSKLLKGAAHLQTALIAALRSVLPAYIADEFVRRIKAKQISFPRRSTVYRHRLTLHAGWLLSQRRGWADLRHMI